MPLSDHPSDALPQIIADLAALIGLSRPAGRCFAGIWRQAQAPCADDLVAGMGLSRSNVSTALKELREWGLISVARAPGDRREYFTAPADPWEVMRIALAGRQRRYLAPLVDRVATADSSGAPGAAALAGPLTALSGWIENLAALDAEGLAQAVGAASGRDGTEKHKKKKKKAKA